jgi:hypothetical protein
MYCYLVGLSAVGMIGPDIDLSSVLLKLMLCFVSMECSATTDHWFSSLVCLMCSEILVDVWWPICLMYTLLHRQWISWGV